LKPFKGFSIGSRNAPVVSVDAPFYDLGHSIHAQLNFLLFFRHDFLLTNVQMESESYNIKGAFSARGNRTTFSKIL
jgi:hypothetical protein